MNNLKKYFMMAGMFGALPKLPKIKTKETHGFCFRCGKKNPNPLKLFCSKKCLRLYKLEHPVRKGKKKLSRRKRRIKK